MSEISAFGVIHKSLVSKKVYPPGTTHRYLWRSSKVAPQYGGTKVPKPGKTPPNPNSRNSNKKAARLAALEGNTLYPKKVKASGRIEDMPHIKSTKQGAMAARVIANSKPGWAGKNPKKVAEWKDEVLRTSDRIGGDVLGQSRYAGSDMRTLRAVARRDGTPKP